MSDGCFLFMYFFCYYWHSFRGGGQFLLLLKIHVNIFLFAHEYSVYVCVYHIYIIHMLIHARTCIYVCLCTYIIYTLVNKHTNIGGRVYNRFNLTDLLLLPGLSISAWMKGNGPVDSISYIHTCVCVLIIRLMLFIYESDNIFLFTIDMTKH